MTQAEQTPAKVKRCFIVGCRRSGTTWTMLLLAQHPQVVALQQIDFFRRLNQFGKWFQSHEDYGMRVLTCRPPEGIEKDEDQIARLTLKDAFPKESFGDLVRPLAEEVYERMRGFSPEADVIVEQTPEYVQVWEDVLQVFPDAYFLHIVRDPRSVFCSHRNAAKSWADPTRFSYDPVDVASEWKQDVTRARQIGQATDRYMEIRYEDMRADGPGHLARILDWLDMPSGQAFCEQAVESCKIEKMQKSSHAPKGFFRKGEVKGWRNEMSASEIQTVEYISADLMRELGYELKNSYPVAEPVRVRMRRKSQGMKSAVGRWAWGSDGPVRNGAARVLKSFPGLRKALLRNIKKPASS